MEFHSRYVDYVVAGKSFRGLAPSCIHVYYVLTTPGIFLARDRIAFRLLLKSAGGERLGEDREGGLTGVPVRIRLAVSIRVYGLREVYTWPPFAICRQCLCLELHPTIPANIYLIRRLSSVEAFPRALHIYITYLHYLYIFTTGV